MDLHIFVFLELFLVFAVVWKANYYSKSIYHRSVYLWDCLWMQELPLNLMWYTQNLCVAETCILCYISVWDKFAAWEWHQLSAYPPFAGEGWSCLGQSWWRRLFRQSCLPHHNIIWISSTLCTSLASPVLKTSLEDLHLSFFANLCVFQKRKIGHSWSKVSQLSNFLSEQLLTCVRIHRKLDALI